MWFSVKILGGCLSVLLDEEMPKIALRYEKEVIVEMEWNFLKMWQH